MRNFIRGEIAKTQQLMADILASEELLLAFEKAARMGIEALKADRKVLLCGNGGSAAQAQHIAAELVGRLNLERAGLPAIALTTDGSILTAIGNDYGYDAVFARQIEAIAGEGDLLVALSTSGRSRNVLEALKAAAAKGMVRIGLTGRNPGPMEGLCDHLIPIPSEETQIVQEGHLAFGHIFCGLIDQAMAEDPG